MQQLNIELHLRTSARLANASDLPLLLRHVVQEHGFRLARAVSHTGWFEPPPSMLAEVKARWGFKEHESCVSVHFLRESGIGSGVCVGRDLSPG